jgi:hypothetical protein
MVADIRHDVQPQPAMGGDRFVKRGVEIGHQAFKVRTLAARPQAYSRPIALWRGLFVNVDTEIDPDTIKILLDGLDDA